jgi:hypothetical protein
MKNYKKGFAPIGIVIIIIIIGISSIYFIKSKKGTKVENEVTIDTVASSTNNTATENRSNGEVYENSLYGFKFQYPSDWKLTTSSDKRKVSVSPNIKTELFPNKTTDSFTVTFMVQQKADFEPQGTKIGYIVYDGEEGTLVDASDDTPRCLKAQPLANSSSTVLAISYSGSLMSDPVYHSYAINTNRDYLIIAGDTQFGGPTEKIRNQIKQIYSSFKMVDGFETYYPACSKI